MAYSWRKAIPHNIKMLLQKKATEKWYRAVPFKNLPEGSEGISVEAKEHQNTRVWRIPRGKRAATRKNKTLPESRGRFGETGTAIKNCVR
jgi:hypothetical protein